MGNQSDFFIPHSAIRIPQSKLFLDILSNPRLKMVVESFYHRRRLDPYGKEVEEEVD
jgi:hypothetical protein